MTEEQEVLGLNLAGLAMDAAIREISGLRAENERLRQQRDEARCCVDQCELQAENARLRDLLLRIRAETTNTRVIRWIENEGATG